MNAVKKALVLAGGFDQIELIKQLKQRGYYVLLADYYDNPPAKQTADKHYQISTLDEEAVLELAVKENVEIIVTACTDQALMTVASVSGKLGLPTYINAKTAKNVTNKEYMKKVFVDNGIPTSPSIVVKQAGDIDTSNLKFPLVVKPVDCNSSKGVTKVKSEQELSRVINECIELSRSRTAIIERYIEGKELSIDAWAGEDDSCVLSVSESTKVKGRVGFTICKSSYPVGISKSVEEKIEDIVAKIKAAFDLKNCPILVQAIVENEDVWVIEFSARMGGGSKYKFIEYMSSIPIMEIYLDSVLNGNVQDIKPCKSEKVMELIYLYCNDGVIGKFVNFEELYKQGLIKEIYWYKRVGSKIDGHYVSGDRPVGILLVEDDYKKLADTKQRIINELDILDTNGNSIIIKEYIS